MRRDARRSALRGFTLIELMLIVTIIGILSSVAIPSFTKFQLRSRTTERALVLDRFKRAIDEKFVRDGRLAATAGGSVTGPWTPAYPPVTTKRPPDFRQVGWRELEMEVEGNTYYSYLFTAWPSGTGEQVIVYAAGDLDGDGVVATRYRHYVSDNAGFHLIATVPPDGEEDVSM